MAQVENLDAQSKAFFLKLAILSIPNDVCSNVYEIRLTSFIIIFSRSGALDINEIGTPK